MDIVNPGRCRLDEDGFFILVDRQAYAAFVAPDWTLDQLQANVERERATGHIAAVYLGQEQADLPVDVRSHPSPRASTREARSVLAVGGDGLWVPDYTDLTMAAQFDDAVVVPYPQETAHLVLPAGRYAVTFRRLREVAQPEALRDEPALEVVLAPAGHGNTDPGAGGIAWLDY